MSELPISSPYRNTPEVPVDDAVREQLNSRLNTAYADGKLDAEDYRARLDTLYAAQRLGELVPVVEGLPPLSTYAEPAIVAASSGQPGQPGQLAPARSANGVTVFVVGGVAAVVVLIVILLLILL
ncbi:MAG: DUF1707 SHOCT-like domain-containing protein [Nocardioidaceae bacterium]